MTFSNYKQDLIELRQEHWKPRRAAGGPKTIEEVHRDAYLQEIEDKRQINSLPPLSPDGSHGGRNHSQNHTPINHVPKKSDWTTVPNKAARFQPRKSENKVSYQMEPIDDCDVTLLCRKIKTCFY